MSNGQAKSKLMSEEAVRCEDKFIVPVPRRGRDTRSIFVPFEAKGAL